MALTSPTWSFHPLSRGPGVPLKLNPGSSLTIWAKLLWMPVSSSCTAMPVPDHEPCWSWPIDWFPSLTSDLPHHYGPAWWSLGCVWPWLALLDLIPTCGLTSWLEVGPALSPQNCLMIWTWLKLATTCKPVLLASLGSCGTGPLAGEGYDLAATLSPSVPHLFGSSCACSTLTLS